MRIDFKCGCFFANYIGRDGKERGGLACCNKHEAPYQKLENLGLVEIGKVRMDDENFLRKE